MDSLPLSHWRNPTVTKCMNATKEKEKKPIGLKKPLVEKEHLFWGAGKGLPEEVEFKLRPDK